MLSLKLLRGRNKKKEIRKGGESTVDSGGRKMREEQVRTSGERGVDGTCHERPTRD